MIYGAISVLILYLTACKPSSSAENRSATADPVAAHINQYSQARAQSLFLRKDLERLAVAARQHANSEELPAAFLKNLRTQKYKYFALREPLMTIALLNSSAIVERPQGRELRLLLLEVSLALLAASDLVQNFHSVGHVLHHDPRLVAVWNDADLERNIPEGSWDSSLQTSADAHYRDLFAEALARLKKYRSELARHIKQGDKAFLALYPNGIDSALQAGEQSYALLRSAIEENLLGDERELRALVERSKTLRASWAATAPALRSAIARDGGLIRGHVHFQVHAAKRDYLKLREHLYHLAVKHASKLTRNDIPYQPEFRLRAVAISVLAALTLYENAKQLQEHVLKIPGVKSLLNQGDPALGIPPQFWDAIEREFVRTDFRALLEAGIRMLDRWHSHIRQRQPEDPSLNFFAKEISASAALSEVVGESPYSRMGRALRYHLRQTTATMLGVAGAGKAQVSKGFGNLVGTVEFRKGKLFGQSHWVEFVRARLKPGDILLEKTPFRLTDRLIPGHFGHVAIYVGTKDDLRQLGLLEHPWVAPHRAHIDAGKTIIEALRDGIQINTIERFLNIDDLAILRPKKDRISPADVTQAIALAFSHIGKKYDFRFDNNTWDTIVCSELAFQTYINVRWPIAKVFGSYTISPDDVAVAAGSEPSRPFDLITFIQDGALVHDQATGIVNEIRYIDLIGKRYAAARF
ncbi:MAG TPA: YiiX/YebB-like N1pC/P60 family cysteine hydrolase [Candidatus Acidoferrales bacterium]|nr:YiiX/YebB-like N1pC/P60 family cysteine hydrolase [Candidatus Acidoferrales bacterium]